MVVQIPLGCCDKSDGSLCWVMCCLFISLFDLSPLCSIHPWTSQGHSLWSCFLQDRGLFQGARALPVPACTGKLQLLVIPLGFTTAYRSDALFLFPGTHPFYSLNHFTHPSHLPLGHDFILFKQLHYCSIGALLFESKNVQLE